MLSFKFLLMIMTLNFALGAEENNSLSLNAMKTIFDMKTATKLQDMTKIDLITLMKIMLFKQGRAFCIFHIFDFDDKLFYLKFKKLLAKIF